MAVVVTDTAGSVPRHEWNACVKPTANHKLAACHIQMSSCRLAASNPPGWFPGEDKATHTTVSGGPQAPNSRKNASSSVNQSRLRCMFPSPVRRLSKRRCVDGCRRSAYPERQPVSFPKLHVLMSGYLFDIRQSIIFTLLGRPVHFPHGCFQRCHHHCVATVPRVRVFPEFEPRACPLIRMGTPRYRNSKHLKMACIRRQQAPQSCMV